MADSTGKTQHLYIQTRIKGKNLYKPKTIFWGISESVLPWFYQQNEVPSCKTSSKLSIKTKKPKLHQNYRCFVHFLDLSIDMKTVTLNNLNPHPKIHTCLKTVRCYAVPLRKWTFIPAYLANASHQHEI